MDKILQNRVLSHVLFWLAVLLAAPFFSELNNENTLQAFIFRAVGLPMKILATYVLVYYQIPTFLQKGKYFQFLLSFAFSLYVFCIIYRINNIYIAETLAGGPQIKETIWEIISQPYFTIGTYLFRVYFFGFLFLFIKMVKNDAREKNQMELLKKEKAVSELNFLKAQIHPHFLFNTLNNLYALTLDKSDKAPTVVEKLSEMLDYMLYQANEDKVAISREVELIQNFIDLEMLRYGDRLKLRFDKEIEGHEASIAPMVLLSIVENAFKHGVSGSLGTPVIEISLEVRAGILHFRVFNTKPSSLQKDEQKYREGIGTKNIQRQLELVYPDRYSWQVDEQENSYEVMLSIEL